jgi:hypothetical protein
MALHWSQYRTGASRRRDYGVVTGIAIFLGVYATIAVAFIWLMQPNSVPNSGIAAYRPPPNTIVNYDPPAASSKQDVNRVALELPARPAVAGPIPETPAPVVAEPKKEPKKTATRTAPKRENQARENQAREQRNAGWGGWERNPTWNYAQSRSQQGARPWF